MSFGHFKSHHWAYRFRFAPIWQCSASLEKNILSFQMNQKIHPPVAMDLQQNRRCLDLLRNSLTQTCNGKLLIWHGDLLSCSAFAQCIHFDLPNAGRATRTNHLRARSAGMHLPAHFVVGWLLSLSRLCACLHLCGCFLVHVRLGSHQIWRFGIPGCLCLCPRGSHIQNARELRQSHYMTYVCLWVRDTTRCHN